MPILLSLALIGAGFLLFASFAGATLALPLALGLYAGFGASALGIPPFSSFMIGTTLFMAVIGAGRFASLTLRTPQARAAIALLFAVPAGIAGFSAASAIALLAGFSGVLLPLASGLACAAIAARRLQGSAI
jgi:hypothetical protein